VDVYSLGAILYELLTGPPPFRGATVADTLEQVRTLDPVPPRRLQPKLPRDLETITLACLHKEPRRRYASAAALADDLRHFLRGEPIKARPVTVVRRLAKWARRKPTAAALLVVSGLSLLAFAGGVAVHNGRLRAAVAEAQKQQHRADANYRKARDAVQRMLARLERPGLADLPRLNELRQEQLEDALAFYQGALRELDDPAAEVRRDAAETCAAAAAIEARLGRSEAAADNCRQALALYQGLADEQPGVADHRAHLAACNNGLGRLHLAAGRHAEAEQSQQQAVALAEVLADAQPAEAARLEERPGTTSTWPTCTARPRSAGRRPRSTTGGPWPCASAWPRRNRAPGTTGRPWRRATAGGPMSSSRRGRPRPPRRRFAGRTRPSGRCSASTPRSWRRPWSWPGCTAT
jgi:tetratricopeptide (TPR) repeat protein